MRVLESLDILLVEDNRDIAENVALYLERFGHRIDMVHSGSAALELLQQSRRQENTHYQVLILDVMLPGIDGFNLAIKIRHNLKLSTPILFLTARDTLDDKLEGFTVGGDDYLTKPFDIQELAARVLALARRAGGKVLDEVEVGLWRIEHQHYRISFNGSVVKTTRIGFQILQSLITNAPNLVLRRDIEKMIWGEDPPDSDALRSHMFVLRKAITGVTQTWRIVTTHGVGYSLQNDDA